MIYRLTWFVMKYAASFQCRLAVYRFAPCGGGQIPYILMLVLSHYSKYWTLFSMAEPAPFLHRGKWQIKGPQIEWKFWSNKPDGPIESGLIFVWEQTAVLSDISALEQKSFEISCKLVVNSTSHPSHSLFSAQFKLWSALSTPLGRPGLVCISLTPSHLSAWQSVTVGLLGLWKPHDAFLNKWHTKQKPEGTFNPPCLKLLFPPATWKLWIWAMSRHRCLRKGRCKAPAGVNRIHTGGDLTQHPASVGPEYQRINPLYFSYVGNSVTQQAPDRCSIFVLLLISSGETTACPDCTIRGI